MPAPIGNSELGDDFFENGVFNRRYGGDLQGVIDKLDYLADLGVNAIYFNPVFYGRSLHKYDGASMHHIDPYFGPDPAGDFKLIATETSDPQDLALDRGRQAVSRSCSASPRTRHPRDHRRRVQSHGPRLLRLRRPARRSRPQSPYNDWYIVAHFDDPATPQNEFQYKGWWGVDSLPEFADNAAGDDLHPGPKQYVIDITRRWMDPNGDGDPATASTAGGSTWPTKCRSGSGASGTRSSASSIPMLTRWPRCGTTPASFSSAAASRRR